MDGQMDVGLSIRTSERPEIRAARTCGRRNARTKSRQTIVTKKPMLCPLLGE